MCFTKNSYIIKTCHRGVAQSGSVFVWGAKGRGFKSRHSDQLKSGGIHQNVNGTICAVRKRSFRGCQHTNTHGKSADKQLEKFSKIEVYEIFIIFIIVYQDRNSSPPQKYYFYLKPKGIYKGKTYLTKLKRCIKICSHNKKI